MSSKSSRQLRLLPSQCCTGAGGGSTHAPDAMLCYCGLPVKTLEAGELGPALVVCHNQGLPDSCRLRAIAEVGPSTSRRPASASAITKPAAHATDSDGGNRPARRSADEPNGVHERMHAAADKATASCTRAAAVCDASGVQVAEAGTQTPPAAKRSRFNPEDGPVGADGRLAELEQKLERHVTLLQRQVLLERSAPVAVPGRLLQQGEVRFLFGSSAAPVSAPSASPTNAGFFWILAGPGSASWSPRLARRFEPADFGFP